MKRIILLMSIVSMMLMLVACGTQTALNENSSDNELPAFAFALEGYIEMQPTEIDNIDPKEYLPNQSMKLTYKQPTDNEDIINCDYIEIVGEQINFYSTTNPLDENDGNISEGQFYYDKTADCLAKKGTGMLGNTFDNAYLIPMGKSLKQNDESNIQNVTYLFSVTTDTGTYKDCVAVIEEIEYGDTSFSNVHFYAKGVGNILSVTNADNDLLEFDIYSLLTKIEPISDGASLGQPSNEIIVNDDIMFTQYFYDGQRFECFETSSGEDLMLTVRAFYEENNNTSVSYKAELSNGVEFWFDYYAENRDNSIKFTLNSPDNSYADLLYDRNASEFIITAGDGLLYDYSGTYIGLPDTIEE